MGQASSKKRGEPIDPALLVGQTPRRKSQVAAPSLKSVALAAKYKAKPTPPLAPLTSVTYGARKIGNSFLQHTPEELAALRQPPQLPHIMSIYRNKM